MHGLAMLLHEDGTVARKLDSTEIIQAVYELADACCDELRLASHLGATGAHSLMLRAHIVSLLGLIERSATRDLLRDLLAELADTPAADDPTDWTSASLR